MKALIKGAVVLILALGIALNAEISMSAAAEGIGVCLRVIIPSLFPFFVCAGILVDSGFARVLGVCFTPVMRPLFGINGMGALALFLGLLSGYPTGARIAAQMYEAGECSGEEAEKMLAFCNNSGPLFIIGAVGIGIYKSAAAGAILLAAHILAAITTGILFRFSKSAAKEKIHMRAAFKREYAHIRSRDKRFLAVVGESVQKAVMALSGVCGLIIFFRVITALLEHHGIITLISRLFIPLGFGSEGAAALAKGLFEITLGVNAAGAINAPLELTLPLTSIIIAWAGLSVHMQTINIAGNMGLRLRPYFAGKLVSAALSAIYVRIILALAPFNQSAWLPSGGTLIEWGAPTHYFAISAALCAALALIAALLHPRVAKK